MGRVFHAGAEIGHSHTDAAFGEVGTAFTYDTGTVRSGSRSWKIDASAASYVLYTLSAGAVGRRWFATIWFYVPSASGLPGSDSRILAIQTGAAAMLCGARLTTAGKIQLVDQAGTQIGSDSAETVATNTWHRLDLGVRINVGSTDYAECRLNGVSVASTTTGAFSDTAPARVLFGWFDDPGTSEVLFFDDFILNDDTGTTNLTWALDESVLLLLPTAVAARDAGWVGGGGGTTNLYEAVNNIPPAGLDNAAATDTSQVENAVSTTTDEIDFTMTTYTAAGVGASDLITAVYAVMAGGNSSTTGTDTIGLEVESNPAIAESVVSVDVNDGTYPTGWLRGQTAVSEMPVVARGTGPVASLRKGVATTRVCACCFVGMQVSVFPDPTTAPTGDTFIATETFTGSAGTQLQTHNADWARAQMISGDSDHAVLTDDNRVRIENSPVYTMANYRNTGNAPVSAEYAITADIIPDTVASGGAGVVARMTTNDGYLARYVFGTGWCLDLIIDGSLSSRLASLSATLTADQVYSVELRCTDAYKAVLIDGLLTLYSEDNTLTAAGHAGLVIEGSSGSNTTGWNIDNFTAQDYDTAAAVSRGPRIASGGL